GLTPSRRRAENSDSRFRGPAHSAGLGGPRDEARRSLGTGGGSMPSWRPSRSLAIAVCLMVCSSAVSVAQTTGDIEGRITDLSGSPLPSVRVEATSPKMQGIRVEISGRAGKYRVLAVPPGKYRIKASLEGFETTEESVTVSLDATATL